MENGTEIGYTIIFGKSNPITIYHGKDGADGKSPVVGVSKDTDGLYYWTLDGNWLMDASGNKVQAQGKDGADGKDAIAPQLKIEDGYWYISTDGGKNWEKLDKATGNDGLNGDSIFSSVSQDENSVYFTLSNGTVITISKNNGGGSGNLTIKFSVEDNYEVFLYSVNYIDYTIEGATGKVDIDFRTEADQWWTLTNTMTSQTSGRIRVAANNPSAQSTARVIIHASCGNSTAAMGTLTFVYKK